MIATAWLLLPALVVYMLRNEMYIKYANKVASEVETAIRKKIANRVSKPVQPDSGLDGEYNP